DDLDFVTISILFSLCELLLGVFEDLDQVVFYNAAFRLSEPFQSVAQLVPWAGSDIVVVQEQLRPSDSPILRMLSCLAGNLKLFLDLVTPKVLGCIPALGRYFGASLSPMVLRSIGVSTDGFDVFTVQG